MLVGADGPFGTEVSDEKLQKCRPFLEPDGSFPPTETEMDPCTETFPDHYCTHFRDRYLSQFYYILIRRS